ncbi:SMR family transporter, partial [Mesorhizobium sp.]
MSWILLFFAGLFEIGWAIGLKYTDGFSRPLPTVLTVVSMVVSLVLLGLALKT